MPPRARRALFFRFLEKVEPDKTTFDFREVIERYAQELEPPMQGVAFLRALLEELEDRTWGVPQHFVDRLLTSLPASLRDGLSDDFVYTRIPQAKWLLFRPVDWVYTRAIVEGLTAAKHLSILHIDVQPMSAPYGQEKLMLLLEADDLSWVERRFRLIHRRVNYDDECEQRRLLTSLVGPSVIEPLVEDHLRMWLARDRRVARLSARLERWPETFADLLRPSFELSINVVFEPLALDQQGLTRRLKEIFGKVM